MFQKLYHIWLKIAGQHRSDDETEQGSVFNFFFPKLRVGFFIRVAVVAISAALFFSFVLMPCRISGGSMMPTYPKHGFTFCNKLRYWFRNPQRGDVVIIHLKDKVYYLKRIVGLPGDTVEFRDGDLYLNGKKQDERKYIRYASDWNLPPRKVEPGHYYVVGDNRSMPIEQHVFGSTRADRIVGSPIW